MVSGGDAVHLVADVYVDPMRIRNHKQQYFPVSA